MSAAVRSPQRLSVVPTDWPESGMNHRRVEDAFRLLGEIAARIVTDPNPSAYILDLASQGGALQNVWGREENSAATIAEPAATDRRDISEGDFGPVNAERYIRAQKALSTLLSELTRPECSGAATLRLRGIAGEISDDIRGESRRQWRF
jgi:hypothetical protein